jgi:hypothetical protein
MGQPRCRDAVMRGIGGVMSTNLPRSSGPGGARGPDMVNVTMRAECTADDAIGRAVRKQSLGDLFHHPALRALAHPDEDGAVGNRSDTRTSIVDFPKSAATPCLQSTGRPVHRVDGRHRRRSSTTSRVELHRVAPRRPRVRPGPAPPTARRRRAVVVGGVSRCRLRSGRWTITVRSRPASE